jgi:hypothetical protein
MARLKYRNGDGTTALFDPSDDPFPPFPPQALSHLPPTLPPQAADQAQPQLPTEIPPAQTQSHLPAVQSEAAADASSLALQLTPALTQAEEFCPRTITFTIPGGSGNPGVQVTAVEHQVNGVKTGTIDFTVDVLGNADLRGLFFHLNEAHLNGLMVNGGDGLITKTVIQANSVLNLGQGAEMNGAASPFDVGIRWGTPGPNPDLINFPVHFTLSNAANNLTLDDIAHQEFGARLTIVGGQDAKITTIAPAAPDAVNDVVPPLSIFEDGAGGFGEPSHDPLGVTGLIKVLANDTDADGDTLTITDTHGVQHGTVQIVDGPDADFLPGDAVFYTPNTDYSGPDSFLYCVSDGHGGQDNATVTLNVEAVADTPDLDVNVVQDPDNINVYIINVTATQTDLDGSEFIDRISWTGVPDGVTITPVGDPNPADQPDQIVMQFVVTVPLKEDTDFNLDITAFSQEESNFDEEQANFAQQIKFDFDEHNAQQTFSTTNQSIWDPSLPAAFNDDRFLGFHDADSAKVDIELASAGGSYDITIGFQSTLHATLGDIEATLPYNITIDTFYNVTTDSLQIDPSAVLDPSAHFTTHGPGGSYNLDFVFLAELSAFLHNPIHDFDESVSVDLGFPILDIDSATFTKTIDLPPLNPVATLTLNWPHSLGESTLETNGAPSDADTLHSDGTSVDIVNLDVDVIALALAVLGVSPNPLDLGFVDLLSLDVNGGVDVAQHFDLNSVLKDQDASIMLEDGTLLPFAFGSPLPIIPNASTHDTDQNGQIGFSLHLAPDATLHNETDLGFHVGADLKVLDFGDPFGALFSLGGDLPLGEIPLYDTTFGLAGFNSQDYQFQVQDHHFPV